jgi:hypothetical protein
VEDDSLDGVFIHDFIEAAGGVATADQLQAVMSQKMLRTHLRLGDIVRVCHGVYASSPPGVLGRLAALDLMVGESVVACLGTAAALHGFDTEQDSRIHVLDPGIRMRPTAGFDGPPTDGRVAFTGARSLGNGASVDCCRGGAHAASTTCFGRA